MKKPTYLLSQRLHDYVVEEKIDRVVAELGKLPLNDRMAHLTVALNVAVSRRCRRSLACLLEHGANPNLCDEHDESPLRLAARYGEMVAVELLLSHGADPNLPDRSGFTSLHESARSGHVGVTKKLLTGGALADP